jgi:hypothetical protein
MAGKLDPDSLRVDSFETSMHPVGYNGDGDIAAPGRPITNEPWYDSCCYICYKTGPTMCAWCSTQPPVYHPSDPAICPVTVAGN